jgi:hypothetical protein
VIRLAEWSMQHRNAVAWIGYLILSSLALLVLGHHNVPNPDRIAAVLLACSAGFWFAKFLD